MALDALELVTDDPANAALIFPRPISDELICACGFKRATDIVARAALAMGAVCGRCDASLDCEADIDSGGCTAAGVGSTDEDDDV